MATNDEISQAFQLLIGAGLDYAPSVTEIPTRAVAWVNLLADVPGPELLQAARDLAITSPKFPSIPALREAAYQVKAHNGKAAAANKFDTSQQMVVWEPTGTKDRVKFPMGLQKRLAELEALDRLLTDEEMREVNRLTAEFIK